MDLYSLNCSVVDARQGVELPEGHALQSGDLLELPEGSLVTIEDWSGEWAKVRTCGDVQDKGQALFWIHCSQIELESADD